MVLENAGVILESAPQDQQKTCTLELPKVRIRLACRPYNGESDEKAVDARTSCLGQRLENKMQKNMEHAMVEVSRNPVPDGPRGQASVTYP